MTPKCPDCGRDQEDCSCRDTQNQPIHEGYKLVGLEELFVAVEKADAELSKGNNTEALIGIRVCKSIVGLIKSHIGYSHEQAT